MIMPSLVWGAPQWIVGALTLAGVVALSLLWSYGRAPVRPSVKVAGALLKGLGFTALILCLVEPLLTGNRPRRGANAFAVVADNSRSLAIRDDDADEDRGDWVRERLKKESPWRTRLGQDFDVRSYAFDSHLRAVEGFDGLSFDGSSSAINGSLSALSRRFKGLPLAGILLFTDGNRTDLGDLDFASLPPIYPVTPPSRGVGRDVGVGEVSVSQTNFESAPVVIKADVKAVGFAGRSIVAIVVDESGNEVARQEAKATDEDRPLGFRFQFRPDRKGVGFYTVRAFADSAEVKDKGIDEASTGEQTTANNARLVVVDQGAGPYRVLYVSGRPSWEFKFLRRALSEDRQVDLLGLLRIAKRQPRFDFQAAGGRTTSPLFDGFDNIDRETSDAADKPVLIRLGTVDESELRDGFPKAADELYGYHAIVLDDIEAGFFTQDQLSLIRGFVSRRGGGLLMLGGPDSFADGKYDRTPVGELLPVYLNGAGAASGEGDYRLVLTREGWLQPWVRTRKTEDEERQRLDGMASFRTISPVGAIKPGASVLSQVRDEAGEFAPALVAQQFGKGRVGALMIGDLWRWGLKRKDPAEDDLDRAWRQTVRWLVGDVPGRVDVSVRPKADAGGPAVEVVARVRDAEYLPLDNAKVALKITLPDGSDLTLDVPPEGREAGTYATTYVPRQPGAYRLTASATAPDGSAVGTREAGWAAQPAAEEFARLEPDRAFLKSLAEKTGGEVIDGDRLDAFVAGLSSRDAPITEPWTSPLWHQPLFFLGAIACLAGEWGLRRINGLA
ncbi:glutamine amidotransferase [Tundrisphaera lichenicola]|uniref:glutamine amidotransferase n=1 Tax=Tundrisphaera lichenicola TaxID=2029860 RepID=UPI003EBA7D43